MKNEKEFELIDLCLPYQRKFITNNKRKKIWCSGRQLGKSFSLAYIAVMKAVMNEQGIVLCISTGSRSANELLRKCEQFAQAVKIYTGMNYVASSERIVFENGGRIISLPSGNPKALRGFSACCTIIDECAFIDHPEEVFSAITPTLTRDPNAELIVCSTPAGMNNYFYKLIENAGEDTYVQYTTIDEAIQDGLKINLEDLKRICPDPDVFDVEYRCKFSSEYGAMIDTGILKFQDECPFAVNGIYLGMDVGSTSDRTVISILYHDGVDRYHVQDIITLHKAEYTKQIEVLKSVYEKYRFSNGLIDATGIGSALSEFAKKNVTNNLNGFTFTGQNKTPAYEQLRSKIFDNRITFSSSFRDYLMSDFRNVRRVVNETGKVSYVAGRNQDGHSDGVSSIVLALESSHRNPVSFHYPIAFQRQSRFV